MKLETGTLIGEVEIKPLEAIPLFILKMTVLEQRFLETVPSRLKNIEVGLGQLNENLSKLIERLDTERTSSPIGVLQDSKPLCNHSIIDASGAARLLKENLQGLDHEEVWILLLNHDLKAIKKERITIGTLTQSLMDTRRIVKAALDETASNIILFHNHPSSNPIPFSADIKRTEELRDSLKLFSIDLTDHIIIGGNGNTYYSFAEEKVQSL